MQINSISNYQNQTNFRGQLIFRDAAQYTRLGKEFLDYLSLTSEHIESIKPVRKMSQQEMTKRLEQLAPTYREKAKADLEKFKAVIKTVSGDIFEVTVPENEVSAAKQMVDYTPNTIEPGVVNL